MTVSIVSASASVYGAGAGRRVVLGRELVQRARWCAVTISSSAADEVAVVADVAEELLGQQPLAVGQVEQLQLLAQVARSRSGAWTDTGSANSRSSVAPVPPVAVVEAGEEDVLPVGLLAVGGLRAPRVLLGQRRRRLLLFLGLEQLEERIRHQLLLQVLLQVEQRHVQQVHRLVEAWIDPQVLPQDGVLAEAGLHAAGERRERRRAVRVGPR